MSIGYITIMIRFIIIFSTRVKHFSHCFLRIVRVYPIDTINSPLHERETAQPSIRPWDAQPHRLSAAIATTSVQPHSRVFTRDAQPHYLRAAITATSAQPCSRVFTWDAQPYHLGAAITVTSAQPCSRVSTRNTPPHRLGAAYPLPGAAQK